MVTDDMRLLEVTRLPAGMVEDLRWAAKQQARVGGSQSARWLELLADQLAEQNTVRLAILAERGFPDEICTHCGHHYLKHLRDYQDSDPHSNHGCYENRCHCSVRPDGWYE